MPRIKVCAVISSYCEEEVDISEKELMELEEGTIEVSDIINIDSSSEINSEIIEIEYSVIEDANNG